MSLSRELLDAADLCHPTLVLRCMSAAPKERGLAGRGSAHGEGSSCCWLRFQLTTRSYRFRLCAALPRCYACTSIVRPEWATTAHLASSRSPAWPGTGNVAGATPPGRERLWQLS